MASARFKKEEKNGRFLKVGDAENQKEKRVAWETGWNDKWPAPCAEKAGKWTGRIWQAASEGSNIFRARFTLETAGIYYLGGDDHAGPL